MRGLIGSAGALGTVCARVAWPTWSSGPSTSPLGDVTRQLVVLLLSASCASCDILYGVFHSAAQISTIPADSCVVDALEAIPGITEVSTRIDNGSRSITLHGVERPDQVHRFFYNYRGVRSGFFILVSYNGRATYVHDFIEINQKPPQEIHRSAISGI